MISQRVKPIKSANDTKLGQMQRHWRTGLEIEMVLSLEKKLTRKPVRPNAKLYT